MTEHHAFSFLENQAQVFNRPTVMTKVTKGGTRWLVHLREVTASKAPGREGDVMPTVNWREPDHSINRWRKAGELRAMNRGLPKVSLSWWRGHFYRAMRRYGWGCWLQGWAGGQTQHGSDLWLCRNWPGRTGGSTKLTWGHHHDQMTNQLTGQGLLWASRHLSWTFPPLSSLWRHCPQGLLFFQTCIQSIPMTELIISA